MTKEEKREYDKKYRELNKERLKEKGRLYCQSEAGRAMQKRQRNKTKESGYHNAYCRRPEQREKEKHRRHIRENKLIDKKCLICEQTKPIIEFESFPIFPDKRLYLCKSCQEADLKENGLSFRLLFANIRTDLMKRRSGLKMKDIAEYPYLIESLKYYYLLNKITK